MATVPLARTGIDADGIQVGAAVRASQGQDIALLTNWLRGQGHQLVPGYSPGTVVASGDSVTFHFRIQPRYPTLTRRLILICTTADEEGATFTVEFPDGATASETRTARIVPSAETFDFELSSQANAETELTFTLNNTGGTEFDPSLTIEWVQVWDHPRAELDTGNADYGTESALIVPGQGLTRAQLDGALEALRLETDYTRHLVNWALPADAAYCLSFDPGDTSYQDVFDLSIPVLAPQNGLGNTTERLTCKLYYYEDGTGAWNFRVNPDAGSPINNVNLTSSSFTWSGSATCNIDCEDLSTSDGLQGGTFETVQIQARRTSGTSVLYLAGVSAWHTNV